MTVWIAGLHGEESKFSHIKRKNNNKMTEAGRLVREQSEFRFTDESSVPSLKLFFFFCFLELFFGHWLYGR
uniref:Uncharacterized protein n=1 Tax=Rhizophora mucronata TaxID=61149 RepID=A0A2P2QG86_RHIMU